MRGSCSYSSKLNTCSTSFLSQIPCSNYTHHTKPLPFNIIYYNARSLLPKMDELAAIVEAQSPDLICIVETWLSPEVSSSEISLSGYQVCCEDRDRHGGGVLIYLKDVYHFSPVPTPTRGLELLILILQHNILPTRLCVSVFYRPPSSDSSLIEELSTYLESINCAQFKNFIIIGDFNIDVSSDSHPLFNKLNFIMSTLSLSQIVNEHTHVHHNGTASTIDLIFVSNRHLIDCCSTIPPLSNSDHLGLTANLSFKTKRTSTKGRTVWRYSHADWERACELIEDTDWSSLTLRM